MAEVDKRLLGSWRFYRGRPMNDEEQRAALMLTPVSAPLGLTEWRTTEGEVYAKGANAVSAQVGINICADGVKEVPDGL